MGCEYFKKMKVQKKGTLEHQIFCKNFALSFEEILEIQEDLQSHLENRPNWKKFANLKKLGKEDNFSIYLNKKEPKFNFKDCYSVEAEELNDQNRENIRSIGELIKLMKLHFGLNCSLKEINELLKVNRGIKVVKRMVKYENNKIKEFILDLREKTAKELQTRTNR
jgi:hypothetical protein